jgi:biotin carboxyl carrier protein
MKLRINIDARHYEEDVEMAEQEVGSGQPRLQAVESAAIRAPRVSAPAAPVETTPLKEDTVCRSPVSGIVASVAAQPGQRLQIGDFFWCLRP